MTQRLHIPIHLRWADLDAFGHVNNVQVARLLEEARVRAFWKDESTDAFPTAVVDSGPTASTWTLIARQELEYLVPMPYFTAPVDVQAWFSKIGGASIDICYEVYSPHGSEQVLHYKAQTTLVLVDSSTQAPRRINPAERASWEPYLGEALTFRRS
ncbi:MAG: thioesterase family protein [Microbacteriaceae bacterium]